MVDEAGPRLALTLGALIELHGSDGERSFIRAKDLVHSPRALALVLPQVIRVHDPDALVDTLLAAAYETPVEPDPASELEPVTEIPAPAARRGIIATMAACVRRLTRVEGR